MIEFFILFVIIGFIIGVIQKNEDSAIGIIILIAVIWLFIYGIWAVATFIELLLGHALAKRFINNKQSL